jgi:hypothetical protein
VSCITLPASFPACASSAVARSSIILRAYLMQSPPTLLASGLRPAPLLL